MLVDALESPGFLWALKWQFYICRKVKCELHMLGLVPSLTPGTAGLIKANIEGRTHALFPAGPRLVFS